MKHEDSHQHNVEWTKPDTKEHTAHDVSNMTKHGGKYTKQAKVVY